MRRDILRHPVVPLDFTEENKEIAWHNELLIDDENMVWIKRHNSDTNNDEFIPLWRLALEQLGAKLVAFQGFKNSYADLLLIENPRPGDMYIVKLDETLQTEDNKYIEYMYTKKEDDTYAWERMGDNKHQSIIDVRDDDPTNPIEGYCWLVRK